MTIFELDESIGNVLDMIDHLVDEETGEIGDVDSFVVLRNELDALSEQRNEKISNVACWIKQLSADAEAIKKEKLNLAKRQASCEKKVESLKQYLAYVLNGDKFKDSRVSISYRTSKSVEFTPGYDYKKLPEEFQKITIEPRKTEIKNAIENGQTFEGISIKENKSLQIK